MSDTWRLGIGQLADLAGVSTRTLRHCYRTYPASALIDVLEIRHLQTAGLSLQGAAAARGERARGDASSFLDTLDEAEADLDAELDRLTARREVIGELRNGVVGGEAVLAGRELDSFADITDQLRRLGVSERAIAEQRRAWSALRSIRLPGHWQATVEAGVSLLQHARTMDGLAEALDVVTSLRGVDPGDSTVAAVGDRLVALALKMPTARTSMALVSPDALPIVAVIASCFTAAQVVAVLHAIERLGDESSTAPTA